METAVCQHNLKLAAQQTYGWPHQNIFTLPMLETLVEFYQWTKSVNKHQKTINLMINQNFKELSRQVAKSRWEESMGTSTYLEH